MVRAEIAISLVLATLGVACGGDATTAADAAPPTGTTEVVVHAYDYDFDIETERATTRLTLTTQSPGDCFALPYRAGTVFQVSIDDQPASHRLEAQSLEVCGVGWPESSELVVELSLQVPRETWDASQVGYSVSQDIEGQPFHYLVSWVGGCDRFGPCDSRPDRFARYRFTIRHPEGFQALCPGTITRDATSTTCSFDHPGGPTYSTFGFAVSPSWTEIDLGDWSGVAVTLYDMPSADIGSKLSVAEHQGFFAWMIENFGPYPYGDELRLVVGPTYWSGFEHPGNIVLNDRLTSSGLGSAYSNPLAHTTSHEIAHQWAGDQTTLADTYDFVWKEAMVEYLVFVYEDEHIDPSRALRTTRAWERNAALSQYHLVPGEKPALLDFYGDVYGPGPLVLFRQLEALFSRDAVLMALADLLGEERAISVADVQAALENTTGADLDGYFESWVYGMGAPTWPSFALSQIDEGGGMYAISARQTNSDAGLRGCAFDVDLVGADDERALVHFDLGVEGMEELSVAATPGFVPVMLELDPKNTCLAVEDTGERAREASPARERAQPWVAPAHLDRPL